MVAGGNGGNGVVMAHEGLRPIRCASWGKLIYEPDGTVAFRFPRCKRTNRCLRVAKTPAEAGNHLHFGRAR